MRNSQNNTSNSQAVPKPTSTDIRENTGVREDEINLTDYLRVIWKRKEVILLGSALPALIIGLTIYLT
jgi:uncharacterized protein involved in exopolysaccharide biosynthesis